MQLITSPRNQLSKPKKQGSLYSLDIGKNSGPFLPKDIMPNNPKSIGLLVGSEIVKSHLVMVRTIEDTQLKLKKSQSNLKLSLKVLHSNGLNCVENLLDHSNYLQMQLIHIKKNTEQLYLQQRKFKMQLEDLQHKINSKNAQNINDISPLLKDLYSKVKQSFNQQKNEAYKLTRQLQQISHDKSTILQQILLCEGKIQKLQKAVGISHIEYDQIQEESEMQFST